MTMGHEGATRRQALLRAGAGGAALLTLPGLLAACGSDGTGTASRGRGVGGAGRDSEIDSITWSVPERPETLDMAAGYNTNGMMVAALGLEGLLGLDDQLRLTPLLAESWTSPDPRRTVYRIRQGVRFWDGSPLTADDVAFSLGRHIDPKVGSQLGGFYGNVAAIEATGPLEVTIRMKQPDALFPHALVESFIVPKRLARRLGRSLGQPGPRVNVVGTGAYRITRFDDVQATVERNESYWGRKPLVRRAVLKFVPDPQANLLAVRAKEVDGTFEYPLPRARNWDRLPGVRTQYSPGLAVAFLSFDLSKPPFDDLHVRRAIAHAIDRAGIVRAFLGGHGRPAAAIPAPESWSELAPRREVDALYAKIPQYPFDLDAARRELALSAHPRGFSTEISFPANAPEQGRALVNLAESLKQIGIRLRVRERSQTAWLAAIYAHDDLGMQLLSLTPDYVDPANFMIGVYPSAAAVKNNFNLANFKDPKVDRLIAEQGATSDLRKRTQAIAEVLRISGEQLPYFPLWWKDTPIALSDRFVYQGFNSVYYAQNWLGRIRLRA
ncbi:putative ABC transporter periplasmic solute-binding protein [Patulibacter medicamentivorans]|uniref:Putative ABC transporter periplasmic solute-binding protein n=1 Tax=Patulibacter medicamentivorans TaxID=1097667 RepID=H0E1Q1_9ACTN|nr:ABC transporter substrate-binding protein [Patulibacter medicamentivorans]EHN12394.1 putative ABC transporter periplasmic solute-binding protein [Patulibacter medicamentivorans]